MATTYKYGQKGQDIINLQNTLAKAGYNPGKIDGIYGKNTESAYNNYLKKTTTPTGNLPRPANPTDGTTRVINTGYTNPSVVNGKIVNGTTPAPTGNVVNFGGGTTPVKPATTAGYTAPGMPTISPYQAPAAYQDFKAPEYAQMTYDQAKTQAGDRLNPEYATQLQNALNNVKAQTMGSGFFGQLPQMQYSADTAGQIEAQKASAIAQLAQQLQEADQDNYDRVYNRALSTYGTNLGKYNSDRDFGWNQYQDTKDTAYKDYDMRYGRYRDWVGDKRYGDEQTYQRGQDNRQWNYQTGRDKVADDQWERQFALAQGKKSGSGGGGGGGYRRSSGGSSKKKTTTTTTTKKSTTTKATPTQYPSVKEFYRSRDEALKKSLGW